MDKNRIVQACLLTAGILISSHSFAWHAGGHGGYHRGVYNGYHGYHNGYYGGRGYYGGYGGYGGYGYGNGFYGPVVIGAPRYYASCYFIKKCRHHHCWRQKICR